jgi:hypothetical protein
MKHHVGGDVMRRRCLHALFEHAHHHRTNVRQCLQGCASILLLIVISLSASTAHAFSVTQATLYWGNSMEGSGYHSIGYGSREEAGLAGVTKWCAHPSHVGYLTECSYGGIGANDTATAVTNRGTYNNILVYQFYSCPIGTQYYPRWFDNGVTYQPACVDWSEPPPPPPRCPVTALSPLTDPEAIEHEQGKYSGRPDMSKVDERVVAGAECVKQKVKALGRIARITSGYRPAAYQAHLREIWDKWKLLETNSDPACADVKNTVKEHWDKHGLVYQPAKTSPHSKGIAVDIGGVPQDQADAIAASCNMYRPFPNDKPHYHAR